MSMLGCVWIARVYIGFFRQDLPGVCMEKNNQNNNENNNESNTVNIQKNKDKSGNNDNVKIARIKELVKQLNDAAKKYYMEDTEIMSNLEYDALYDELCALEKETGMVMSNSPTVKVGYEVVSELPKEAHEHPMLSLDKTKDVGALRHGLAIRRVSYHGRWTDSPLSSRMRTER